MTLSDKIYGDRPGYILQAQLQVKDVKQFIKQLKKDIDDSADETDIWDNERWDKFRKILIKKIKERAGDKLI